MRTLWTMLILWSLLCVGQVACGQDRDEIWITRADDGTIVFQRQEFGPDGLMFGVPVTDITFHVQTTIAGPDEPEDPTDPPPGNARLRKLETDVRQVAVTASDPSTANAIGVVFAKVADGLRSGEVSGAALSAQLSQALDLMLSGRPAWNPLKPIVVAGLDNLRSEVGANPTPAQYAATVDAMVRGLGDAAGIAELAATIQPGVPDQTTLAAMQGVSGAIDWGIWLPIILAILKLIFPGLGF